MSKKSYIILISLASVFLLSFIIIASVLAVNNFTALPVDNAVAQFFYSIRGEPGGFTYWFFRIFTELGYTYCIVAIIVIFAIFNRFKLNSWLFAGSTLVVWGFQKVLKPDDSMWWMMESSSSFPSGHSMMAVFVFILLAYLVCTSPCTKTWLRAVICGVCAFAILVVPISRLVLGVHYFTDVLGGMFIGASPALIFVILHSIITRKKHNLNTTPSTLNL